MGWIACDERMPPRPVTPYKVYLVWVLQQTHNATGTWRLHQLDRDAGAWLTLPLGPAGVPQEVTHWCEALDELGSPPPQPYGPRGKTPNDQASGARSVPLDAPVGCEED